MIDLTGKIALVTGGSRGIGRAVCLKLAACGADVAVNFSGDVGAAETVAGEVRNMGRRATAIRADVADAASVQSMMDKVAGEFGGVDILVNNAGVNSDGLLVRMKEEDWDRVIAVNLKGTFNCSQAAAKVMMKKRSGNIINVSSVVGITGNAGQANYTAAKAGVIGLTKTCARELASRNIRVNAVAPGFIETEMTAALSEELRAQVASRIPLGYFGAADDVANCIVFLASDASGYITGQTIVVDGGMVI